MTHSAIRDSTLEIVKQISKYSDDAKVKELLESIEGESAGPNLTTKIRDTLAPVSQHITTKNVSAIATHFATFPVLDIAAKVPPAELDRLWQAVGLTNMLLTTIQMVPAEMLSKIETMTSTMMNALQGGGVGGGGLDQVLRSLAPALAPTGAAEGAGAASNRKRKNKKQPTKQTEFRDKLC